AVYVSVQLMNAGDGSAYLWFGSTCLASFSILAVDGSVVYDYRAHVACGPMFTNLTLGPGDARVFRFTWTQTSDSGIPVPAFRSYRIQGVVLSSKPSPGPSGETTIFVMSGAAGPNLAFTARTDKATYVQEESANVSVILTNIGLETIVMHFGTPCFVEFLVSDETQHAVDNSSKGRLARRLCVEAVPCSVGESRDVEGRPARVPRASGVLPAAPDEPEPDRIVVDDLLPDALLAMCRNQEFAFRMGRDESDELASL